MSDETKPTERTDAFITVKVGNQIVTCNDTELLEYQENLKVSNKHHNLQLSKFKAMVGGAFGATLKKQFLEGGIFAESDISSRNVPRFNPATGKKVADKVVCNLKRFETIKTDMDTRELIEAFGNSETIAPLIELDKELAILEHSLKSQGSLKGYVKVHERYNDLLTLQAGLLDTLKNNTQLMKDVKSAEKVENNLNAIAFRRTTHSHRFSVLLNTLKLVAIEGEIDHRAELHNVELSTRKFDMSQKFAAMLAAPTDK